MEPMHIRRHLRTLLGSASLLTACLAGSACVEVVDEVAEEELLGEQAQAAAASKLPAPLALELDGVSVGPVTSAAGGVSVVEVSATPVGASMKKQVSSLSIEPLRMDVGFATFAGMQSWVDATWNGKPQRKSGIVGNKDGATAFAGALLTDITIPALDGSSKETAKLGIVLVPTQVESTKLEGAVASKPSPAKTVLTSNFRFTLGDLPCTRVARIDSFTVKSPSSASPIGEGRDRQPVSAIDFPDLKVTFASRDFGGWNDYAKKVLADGQIDDKEELSGTIEFLDANMNGVVATIYLENVGIRRLAPVVSGDAGEVQRYQADLYVEKMSFESSGK